MQRQLSRSPRVRIAVDLYERLLEYLSEVYNQHYRGQVQESGAFQNRLCEGVKPMLV
jgi:hypothetical protein